FPPVLAQDRRPSTAMEVVDSLEMFGHGAAAFATVSRKVFMSDSIVIVGAGQAAAQAVQSLRAEGFTGAITMIGDEAYAPYQRPPLSKAYLLGTFAREKLFLKSDDFYRASGCELILNTQVTAIHRAENTIAL